MSHLKLRTLPETYGYNGLQFEFPNGTIVSMRHDENGTPELLIQGDATILSQKSDEAPVEVCHLTR